MRSTILSLAFISALTTASARPQPRENFNPLLKRVPAEWNYHGCWTEESDRQLGGASYAADDMTPATCISFCESKGYSLAGVEYGRECYCGYSLKSKSIMKDDEECNMACSGEADLKCGGSNRITVYASRTPIPIVTNPGPVGSGWTYKSCYEDSVYARTLSHSVKAVGGNTVLTCTASCQAAGYKIAGVEWGNECFCDNTINFSRATTLDGCDMACEGNPLEYCGGAQKLNIYEFEPLPTISTTALTTSSTTTLSTTTSMSTTLKSSTTSSISTTTTTSTTTGLGSITTSLSSSSSSSTVQTTTTTSMTNSATCTPTFTVSVEQQAKDAAAFAFLYENNSIEKMLGAISFKEFSNATIGETLRPVYEALQNWVPCQTPPLSVAQQGCKTLTNTRSFLSCVVFRTSPQAMAKWDSSNPMRSVPESAVTKLWNNHKGSLVPGTGEPLINSSITVTGYLDLLWPGVGIKRDNSNVLYYFGERNTLMPAKK